MKKEIEMELEFPNPIEIVVPRFQVVDGVELLATTSLFRNKSYLQQSLNMAQERAGGEALNGFLSVGCSSAAELDSWLSLYNRGNPGRGLTTTGVDVNPHALAAAQEGVHKLKKTFVVPLSRPTVENTLEEMGFGVSRVPFFPIGGTEIPFLAYRLCADAGPVREGHDVRILEHDATEPLPLVEPVDVALANNILYYLSEAKMRSAVRNVASLLSDRGIISFGGNTHLLGKKDPPPGREGLASLLDEEFDLQPIFTDKVGTPVIFGRA